MMKKRRRSNIAQADLLLNKLENDRERAILFVFVGEGQSIHSGEMNNMSLWIEALNNPKRGRKWKVVCPPILDNQFKKCKGLTDDEGRELLDIKTSIRQHRVKNLNVGEFINRVLDEPHRVEEILEQAKEISYNFNIYLTQDLESAINHCKRHYKAINQRKYGLIASSKGESFLKKHKIDCSYGTIEKINIGAWYHDNKEPEESYFNFKVALTEFQTQGLELEMPIVCWSNDLKWDNGKNGWDPTGTIKRKWTIELIPIEYY